MGTPQRTGRSSLRAAEDAEARCPYSVTTGLPRGPRKGYIDRFGNEWIKGPSRTAGQPFEWDVQLSKLGKAKLGWLSRDGSHLNVSLDGEITHK
ncbi:polymorphic toxin type 17 domain-containing protein [Streptomyces sp. YIM S03343]